MIQSLEDVKQRLFKKRKVVKGPESTPCWIWTGGIRDRKKKKPYGGITYCNKSWLVHRLSYFIFRGPLNPDLELDHLCHMTLCFNPLHLEEVTSKINSARGRSANGEKIKCPKNHLYDFWRVYPNGNLRRGCKQCWADSNRAWRKKQVV